jgi:phage-related protein
MAIGFNIGGAENIVPDKQLGRTSAPRVKLANFGDGYEQRLQDGINSVVESYSLSFVTRTKAEIDDIVAFFDTKRGVVSFNFTIPDSNAGGEKTIRVVCDNYSQTYDYDEYYSCTANFRRVYEA